MKTILYLTQGTPLAKVAAELAISLARGLEASITAQFVVDPQLIFELEGFSGRGLCGSGVFIEAEQQIIVPLVNLGESLLMSFTALAEGQDVSVRQFIDIGDSAREIAQRAADSDVVILAGTHANSLVARALLPIFSRTVLLVQSPSEVLLLEPQASDGEFASILIEHLAAMNIKLQASKQIESAAA